MAFKLNKSEEADVASHVEALRAARATLEDDIGEFNAKLEALRNELIVKEHAFNSVLEEARDFAQAVADRIEGEYDEKSERWQEGDKGQAVQEWLGTWKGFIDDATDIEIDYPQDIDLDDRGDADSLSDLNHEPDA